MSHREIAVNYFKQGYNCAQSVVMAFRDLTGYSEEESARLASSFGGGLARMREVCGTVSGMAIVAGILYGYADPKVPGAAANHYALVQKLAEKFRERNGSIICRELLGDKSALRSTPEPRTEEFYKRRPCLRLAREAAAILDELLRETE